MITYYHRHASEKRFGPGESLGREMTCPVLHIDVELDGEIIGPKRRLNAAELGRARVRLGVNHDRRGDGARQPDSWVFVSMRALRHEVRAAWRLLDYGDNGDLTDQLAPPAPVAAPLDQQLDALKAMPGYRNIVECLRVDRGAWLAMEACNQPENSPPDPIDLETYDGESRERREAYDAILALLGEAVLP